MTKAQALGMEYQIWNEGGQSSRHDDLLNRPILTNLLAEIDTGSVKHLWVYNPDRLSRNETTWGLIRLKLVKQNVTLHTATGIFILSSPTDKLLLGLLSEISSYDNALRAERSRLGKVNRLHQGFWMGGPPPFGYKIEGKKLVANKEEAKWVKFIYQSYCEGKSVKQVRKHLMENGVRTRRGKGVFSLGSLEALLSNTHYAGYYVVRDKKKGENIRCECEAILPPTLTRDANRLRALRSKRRIRESSQTHFYLLREFLVCEHCGSRFSGRTYARQFRSVYYCPRKERNYVNQGTDKAVKCTNSRYLKIAETDDLVWNTVTKVLSESHQFKEAFRSRTIGEDKSHEAKATEISRLKKQLKDTEAEVKSVGESLVNLETDRLIKKRTPDEVERIIASIERHRTELRAKRDEMEGKIHAIETQKKWIDWVTEFGESVSKLSDYKPEDRKKLLDGVVKEIRVRTLGVRSHRLTINFQLPYHRDRLHWIDPKDKSKGYQITGGRDSIDVLVQDPKKKH